MDFSTYTKSNSLDISIIELKDLEEANRMDSEYYRPIFYWWKAKEQKLNFLGEVIKKTEYGISIAMNEEGVGEKIFRMNDLVNGVAINDDLKYADIDDKTFQRYKVKKNDVLFNRVNSIEFVGRTGIFKSKNEDSVFASYLVRVIPDQNHIKPDYLNIFLNCKYGKLEILRKARRAVNQANVNAEELKRFRILIPSLKFQDIIGQLSDNAFKNLELSKSLYSEAEQLLLDELGLSNYKSSTSSIAVHTLDEVNLRGRIDAEFFQPKYDEILEKIANIKNDELGNIANTKKGIEPGSDAYIDGTNGIPFVRVSDLSTNGISTSDKYLSPELSESYLGEYSPKKGEVLITKDGTIGISYAITEDMNIVVSGAIIRLQPTIKIDQHYLALVLNSIICKLQLERFSGGALIAHLKPSDLLKVKIPLLDYTIQTQIAQKVTDSHHARNQSNKLLEIAKKAVEMYIEQDEETAIKRIQNENLPLS